MASKAAHWIYFGRNPKCDRDWINVQRENESPTKKREIKVPRKKGNKSPKRKGEIKVQREKGIKSPNKKREMKVQIEIGNEALKKAIPKTTM